jgi:general secretion pathway protein A
MYSVHFGFREQPFALTSNPDVFYTNPSYQDACANVLSAIHAREGWVVLIGEPGTGKTTVLRRVLSALGAPVPFVFFFNVILTFDEMVALLGQRLNRANPGGTQLERLQALKASLRAQFEAGTLIVVAIDDAHGLPQEVFESLHLLSSDEPSGINLLQIVVAGLSELEAKVAALRSRSDGPGTLVRCRLEPLTAREVGPYIDYRLRRVGCEGTYLFPPVAIERIAAYTEGIPRLINQICDNALRIACDAGRETVSVAIIEEAAHYLELAEPDRLLTEESAATSRRETSRGGLRSLEGRLLRFWPRRRFWLQRLGWSSLGIVLASFLLFFLTRSLHLPPSTSSSPLVPAERAGGSPATSEPVAHVAPAVEEVAREGPEVTREALPAESREHPRSAVSVETRPARPSAEKAGGGRRQRGAVPAPVASTGVASRENALLRKAEGGDIRGVDVLLTAGVPPDARDRRGLTPLMLAVIHNHPTIVKALIERGADVNARDNGGATALMLAVINNRPAIVRALFARGADINARSKAGWAALTYAAWKGNTELVRMLIDSGADVTFTDKRGWTALQYAAWKTTRSGQAEDSYPEILALLEEAGRKR